MLSIYSILKEIISFLFGFSNETPKTKEVRYTKKDNAKSVYIFLIATILCYGLDAYYLLFYALFGVIYFSYMWLLS
jgi:hypothetical protein